MLHLKTMAYPLISFLSGSSPRFSKQMLDNSNTASLRYTSREEYSRRKQQSDEFAGFQSTKAVRKYEPCQLQHPSLFGRKHLN
jgi:hypothetical protein